MTLWFASIGAVLLFAGLAIAGVGTKSVPSGQSDQIKVVAAENFWGSLVSQLGGSKVSVTSIVSDPNSDPHEYQSSTSDARSFAQADYVILNGAGYDSWGNQLLSASPNSERIVLNIAHLLNKHNGDNPHFWYSPTYVNLAVKAMEQDLIKLDPASKSYFNLRYRALTAELAPYQTRIKDIKQSFKGTEVAATEDVFSYLAQAAGLDLISPPAFIKAVAEGSDPPASSLVLFQHQLESGQVKLLVYNKQTVTPLTGSIKQLAAKLKIPIVGISEIVQPPKDSFQQWMNAEVTQIQNALIKSGGK